MTKRRKILLLLAAVLLAVVLAAVFWPSNEPSYNGKALSKWISNIRTSHPDEAGAAEAVHHIGTNAIPCLLEWVQYERPPWRKSVYDFCLRRFNYRIPLDKGYYRAFDATFAFQFLGKDARGAVPELRRMAMVQQPGNPRAMLALAFMGEYGLRPLMEALTNQEPKTRILAVAAINKVGTNALRHFDPEALKRAMQK